MSELQRILSAQAVMNERILAIDYKLDVCITLLSGTPEEPQKGLVVRFDRVEQSARKLSKLIWLLTGGVVTLLCGKVAAFLEF